MATKKVILKEIVNGVAGDSILPQTSIDMVEGLEQALDAAGSVSTISVNGGTPLTPDNNKNIDITIPATVTESTVSGWGFTKNTGTYSKPNDGIPSTDFTSAVQTSLDKADTALQSYTETDPVFSASAASGISSTDISNWNSKTSNVGTITGVTMNGSSKGTSGVVDLGIVITDISSKVDSEDVYTKLQIDEMLNNCIFVGDIIDII